MPVMAKLSTTRAAKKLGISPIALSRYIAKGKVPAPEIVKLGQSSIHLWTEEEIENVRKLLPKIANGRKTRHQKLREALKKQPKKKK
jgi:predicted transcriptional regulator